MSTRGSSSVLGEGSFGCVIQPHIPCSTMEYKDDTKKVSKIMKISKKDPVRSKSAHHAEYAISQELYNKDTKDLFILKSYEICEYKNSMATEDQKSLIQTCFKEDRGVSSHLFLNIIMQRGYEFDTILNSVYTDENLFKVFGHLVLAVKFIARQTEYAVMDMKRGNILMNINSRRYLHPVLIDFSPSYIIGGKEQDLRNYIVRFSSKNADYFAWSPGIRALLLSKSESLPHIKVIKDIVDELLDRQDTYLDKISSKRGISTNDLAILDPWSYYYESPYNYNQLAGDIQETMGALIAHQFDNILPIQLREKLMLWGVATFFFMCTLIK